jgi:acyl-CoA synthetase (AMP-forming)/AMP-acid ligase II
MERIADTQPDVVFLIGPETGRILTFRGLQEQSRFVSIQLQQLRLERGDKVAFLMDNGLLAGARNSIALHQLASTDRSLLVLPLYHINAECVTLIPTLLSGGSVVVPHQFVVSQFWDWMDEHRCTWSALVPTIVAQLLDWKDPRADSREAAFKRIRFLRSSSAPLSPSLHREFLDKFRLPLIQAMGSTEAGNIFSNPVPPGRNKIGSPGLPWGFETRIVNRESPTSS